LENKEKDHDNQEVVGNRKKRECVGLRDLLPVELLDNSLITNYYILVRNNQTRQYRFFAQLSYGTGFPQIFLHSERKSLQRNLSCLSNG